MAKNHFKISWHQIRVQHKFQKVIWGMGQTTPEVYLPRRHFHLARHSVKQRCKDQKHYLPSRASKGFVLLPLLPFLLNSLATCKEASGYVARCKWPSVPICLKTLIYSFNKNFNLNANKIFLLPVYPTTALSCFISVKLS